MAAEGVALWTSSGSLAAAGVIEPLTRLSSHLTLLSRLRKYFRHQTISLVILVDYPGFNLRVAQAAFRAGIPVLYYIAPQAWAWAPHRTETLRQSVRALAVVLPFEEAFFADRGVPTRFVGHPLLDSWYPPRHVARAALHVPDFLPLVGLFPGSRPAEVRRLWPRMRDAARLLHAARPGLGVVVAAVRGCSYPGADDSRLVWGRSEDVLAAADVALCKSGTATLEAAIVGTPSVVTYVADPVSYAVARRAVTVPFIGLPNLVAGSRVVPEVIQAEATPERLAAEILPLLERNGEAARMQRAGYDLVRAQLGSPGAATRTAAIALELVA
jgi:lipid-A-disaccharide synthase